MHTQKKNKKKNYIASKQNNANQVAMIAPTAKLDALVTKLNQKYKHGTVSGYGCVLPVVPPPRYAAVSLPPASVFGKLKKKFRLWTFAEQQHYLLSIENQWVGKINEFCINPRTCRNDKCHKTNKQDFVDRGFLDNDYVRKKNYCVECFQHMQQQLQEKEARHDPPFIRCGLFYAEDAEEDRTCDVCTNSCYDHAHSGGPHRLDVCNLCADLKKGQQLIDLADIPERKPVIVKEAFDGLEFGSLLDWAIFATFGEAGVERETDGADSEDSNDNSDDTNAQAAAQAAAAQAAAEAADESTEATNADCVVELKSHDKADKVKELLKVLRKESKDRRKSTNWSVCEFTEFNSILVNQNPSSKLFGRFGVRIRDDNHGEASYWLLESLDELVEWINTTYKNGIEEYDCQDPLERFLTEQKQCDLCEDSYA